MKYVIGIDSGGTSTRAAAYSLEGELLAESKTGFGNLLINVNESLANIRQSIEDIWEKLLQEDCQLIVLGSAGVDSGNFVETIRNYFSSYQQEIVIFNDALLAHYALLKGEEGCLIIAGTGSNCVGKNDHEIARVGGWGNLLGDEGSGFSIAKKLIKNILDTYDRGESYSPLQKKFMDKTGFKSPFEIIKYVYTSTKDKVAGFSNFISEEAESGSDEAIEILENAGNELAHQTALLVNKLNLKPNPKIAVTGSVLLKNDIVYQTFEDKIKEEYKDAIFIREDISNTIGGFYYYQKHNS